MLGLLYLIFSLAENVADHPRYSSTLATKGVGHLVRKGTGGRSSVRLTLSSIQLMQLKFLCCLWFHNLFINYFSFDCNQTWAVVLAHIFSEIMFLGLWNDLVANDWFLICTPWNIIFHVFGCVNWLYSLNLCIYKW